MMRRLARLCTLRMLKLRAIVSERKASEGGFDGQEMELLVGMARSGHEWHATGSIIWRRVL